MALTAVLRPHRGFGCCTLEGSGSGVVDGSLFIATPIVCGGVVWSLFCCAVFSVLSRFAFISLRNTTLVPLLLLSFSCHVSVPRGAVCDYGISLIYQIAS